VTTPNLAEKLLDRNLCNPVIMRLFSTRRAILQANFLSGAFSCVD